LLLNPRLGLSHDWPGNVRELQNAVQRLVVLSEGDAIGAGAVVQEALDGPTLEADDGDADLRTVRDRFKAAYIRQVLRAHDGAVQATAASTAPRSGERWTSTTLIARGPNRSFGLHVRRRDAFLQHVRRLPLRVCDENAACSPPTDPFSASLRAGPLLVSNL